MPTTAPKMESEMAEVRRPWNGDSLTLLLFNKKVLTFVFSVINKSMATHDGPGGASTSLARPLTPHYAPASSRISRISRSSLSQPQLCHKDEYAHVWA